jgi:hypothetical protein
LESNDLKSAFYWKPLAPIYGLSLRSTPELSRMLSDYAEERWAAKRTIPLELWRCLGNYFTEPLWKLLEIRLAQGEEQEQKALVLALLALQEARSLPRSQELLSSVPRLHHAALAQEFNWNSLQRMQSISLK